MISSEDSRRQLQSDLEKRVPIERICFKHHRATCRDFRSKTYLEHSLPNTAREHLDLRALEEIGCAVIK